MEEEFTQHEDTVGEDHFSNWGSIISTVKDNLPNVDSDSELSSFTEDSDAETIFQRKVITNIENHKGETARNEDGCSSSILFQRLDCRAPQRDCHDLELPIYDVTDVEQSYEDVNGNFMRHDRESSNTSRNGEMTSENTPLLSLQVKERTGKLAFYCKYIMPAAVSHIQESIENVCLKYTSEALESFNLDSVLENFVADAVECDGIAVNNSGKTDKSSSGCTTLMKELVSLSVNQSGESCVVAEKNKNNSQGCSVHFLGDSPTTKEPGGCSRVKTTSCGVTANLPMEYPVLTWSEPTTIYLDLRTKENKNEEESKQMKDIKVKSSHSSTLKKLDASQPRSSLRRRNVKNDDTESDDEDFETWKIMRNEFKGMTCKESSKTFKQQIETEVEEGSLITQSMQITDDSANLLNQITDDSANLSINLDDYSDILHNLEDKENKKTLKELAIRKVKNVKNKLKEQARLNKQLSAASEVNGMDGEGGIYASQRLKKTSLTNGDDQIPNSVAKNKESGKSTVLFAEEPKTGITDTTNIYRDKKMKKKPASSTSIQTDESYPIEYNIKDYANDLLNCSTNDLKVAAQKIVEDKKQTTQYQNQSDDGNFYKRWNSRGNYSIVQNQRKQPPLTTVTSLCVKPAEPLIPWEAHSKLHATLQNVHKKHITDETKLFPLLYDRETSYEPELAMVPDSIDPTANQKMVLLTFHMTSPGCIVMNRTSAGRRFVPIDQTNGLSITYSLLMTWLLALIPDNLDKPYDPPREDVFTIDADMDSADTIGTENGRSSHLVEVPFNVVSLHQVWQDDTQTIVTNAVVVPNFFYKPDTRRKKPKKENAFLQVVWHFLQSNRIQEVCPWHARPESPILYNVNEMQLTCTTKPLSTYITASNDPQLLHKVLNRKPGFLWKVTTNDEASTTSSSYSTNQMKTTMCLIQQETFTYPVCLLDLILRIQMCCLDILSMRLVYVTRRFVQRNILSHSRCDNLDEVVPCVAMAIRGRATIKKMHQIIGPRDPVLARLTDQGSMNATYGEQISKQRGDKDVPTEMNVFHCPRGLDRAQQQLVVWFGGRFHPDDVVAATKNTISDKKDKASYQGKTNGKNRGKHRNSSSPSNSLDEMKFGFEENSFCRFSSNSFLSTCLPSRICLLLSARFPPQYIGDIITIISDQGFVLEGMKRMILNEKIITALNIPSQYGVYFNPPSNPDMTLSEEYYEIDSWWLRPATVFMLTRENSMSHLAGLMCCIQSDLMYRMVPTNEEGHLRNITYQCFHVYPCTESISNAIGSMCKTPDVEFSTGESPRSFYSDSELEQVVVLSLLGHEMIAESGCILQTIFHGEFSFENEINSSFLSFSNNENESGFRDEFRGFELLGIKYIPSTTSHQAKELTPFEVGTRLWHDSIPVIKGSPLVICALRRVDAFHVLEAILNISPKDKATSPPSMENMCRLMSPTPEIAYRQIKTFFCEKELFCENRCRPLLKYLPPPLRIAQYLLCDAMKSSEEGSGDLPSDQNTIKIQKRKKKNLGKKQQIEETSVNFEESIFSTILSTPRPLFSVLVIKPDAFPRHFVKILKRLYKENFIVVAARMSVISEEQAFQIMSSNFEKMRGERRIFVSHMTSAASLILCVQRSNAVRKLLELAGPSNPRSMHRHDLHMGNGNWRAEFGIDEFSNALHVSENYVSANQELKLFFPEGLCCHETIELKMEQVPTPAEDNIMCKDKMKGREIIFGDDVDVDVYGSSGMQIQPVCVVLSSALVQPHKNGMIQSKAVPPYINILEQLITQGYEICALRMCWFMLDQAQFLYDVIGEKQGDEKMRKMIKNLTDGPNLLILLQRENGLILFDSIIGSCLKHQSYLHHKDDFLRTQTQSQTHQTAKFLFHRTENHRSVLQIVHKRALEWKQHENWQ